MNKKGDKSNRGDFNNGDNLTGCICPEKCLINKPIDPKIPGDAQKIICSNTKCSQILFIHRSCFDNWEKKLVENMLRTSRTRGRDWTTDQWYHNLWLKKGYEVIFPHCTCPCGGHMRKDVDYVVPGQRQDVEGGLRAAATVPKPKQKIKQKQLPALVVDHHKNPVGKSLPGISKGSNYGDKYLARTTKSVAVTNRFTNLSEGDRCFPTTNYGWSEFESRSTPSSWSSIHNTATNCSSNRNVATKSYIVKPSIETEKDLIQLLIELLKSNGVPLKVTDGRVLALVAQSSANLITKIQSDECGGILNWAKSAKQFYIDNDFIDLIDNAPVTKPKQIIIPKVAPNTTSPLSQNSWQVAVGRRTAKATSFSLADLDDFQLVSLDSRSSGSYEECLGSSIKSLELQGRELQGGASGDAPSGPQTAGQPITDEESSEKFYPAFSSPEATVNGRRNDVPSFDFKTKLQEMYGQFLTCSQSIEVTYAYERLAKDIEKLRDSMKN